LAHALDLFAVVHGPPFPRAGGETSTQQPIEEPV